MADVCDALDFLNLPRPSEDAMKLLSLSEERGKFKRSLQECVNGGVVDADTKRYLTGLVRCLSQVVRQGVEALGFDGVPLEALFYIGKTNGMAFKNALDAAINKNTPNSANGMSLVASSIREAMDHIGAPSPRSMPSASKAPVPVSSAPAPQPSRQPESPSPAADSEELLPSRDPDDEEAGKAAEYLSTHAYGGKAALCFNAAKSKDKKHFTVVVDGAEAIGERTYDWKNAVNIQLGSKELPLLFGVMVGWRQAVKFDAHGAAHDKTFEFERQDGKFFGKVMGKVNNKAVARAVPVGPADALPIMQIVFAQIVKEAPKELQGSPDLIFQMMRAAQNIKPL